MSMLLDEPKTLDQLRLENHQLKARLRGMRDLVLGLSIIIFLMVMNYLIGR